MTAGAGPSPPLDVVAYGLCTAVGLGARVSAAEMAAGSCAFVETDVRDRAGGPVRAARMPLVDLSSARGERMHLLARTALEDLLVDCPPDVWAGRLALLLATPPAQDSAGPADGAALATLVAADLRAITRAAPVWQPLVLPLGRAAFFAALVESGLVLGRGGVDAVVVGAVDSACSRDSLRALARANRLLGRGNRDGLIPGEAAGFVVLRRRAGGAARIVGVSTAPASPKASPGQALAGVFRALEPGGRASHVYACQTGERRWGSELALAMLRAPRVLPEPFAMTLSARSVGDVGAAAGVVQTVAAIESARRRRGASADAARPLVYGSSDDGLVGGCLLETTP